MLNNHQLNKGFIKLKETITNNNKKQTDISIHKVSNKVLQSKSSTFDNCN